MYLRETRRKNKDGSVVSYLQLAHNERHPETGSPAAKVIHNFGRADQVDRDALARLVSSISRFLEPARRSRRQRAARSRSSTPAASAARTCWISSGSASGSRRRSAGGRGTAPRRGRRRAGAVRARSGPLPGAGVQARRVRWVTERVAILSCPAFDDHAAYAAMDFLLEALGEIAQGIFDRTANLLNLSCDVIFVDTSSTYWEVDVADEVAELATARARGGRARSRTRPSRTSWPPVSSPSTARITARTCPRS